MARPPSDIRARLVDAARARFLEHGIDGASLRDIARDAETSLGIVVYWFPKKEDLFDEVLESAYGPIVADLARLLGEQASTRERLHAVVLRIANASGKELDVFRLVAREAIGSASRRRRIVRRFLKGHVPHLLAAMKDGVKRGELDSCVPLPVMVIAFVALGAVPQIVRRAAGLPARLAMPGKERLAAISIELFFRALGGDLEVAGPRRLAQAKSRERTTPLR
jgi:AcrR family transcriptional regulator